MAISLLGSANARVDWGDLAGIAGATAVTWLWNVKLTANPVDGARFWSQWGNVGGQGWTIQLADTDEFGIAFTTAGGGGGQYHTLKTSGFNFANGSLYRCALTFIGGSPPTVALYVNNATITLIDWFGSANVTAIPNVGTSVQLGHESAEGIDGQDGDYSEAAIYTRAFSAAEALAYTRGHSPRKFHRSRLIYSSLLTTDTKNVRSIWSDIAATLTGGANAAHPSMFHPTGPVVGFVEAGPTEFEFEGSGGLAFGGAAVLAGLGLGGITGAGGMAFGGSDPTARNAVEGDGGMAFGGTADTTAGIIVGSGGMAFGGHARGGKGGPGRGVDCGPTILGEECDI